MEISYTGETEKNGYTRRLKNLSALVGDRLLKEFGYKGTTNSKKMACPFSLVNAKLV